MSDLKPNIKTIFCDALELDSPQQRAKLLDMECGGDAAVRARVEALLAAHFGSERFLGGTTSGDDDESIDDQLGSQIGPYRLIEPLGEGGFGVVYLAEQSEPVARRVALKIIKPGMDSRQVIARFEAERQALAVMDHPNVSKVLDAGTTESGRPYFVMELVKGVSITQYCDERKLNLRERLELFVPVCQAIQHAHQKGIIHRDIKPSNVLVARYDDRAVPKIIDFGVAKATQQRLTEKTVFTQFGQIVGTFEYMSPEQAQLNQLDIDTRSDVYSLGVLLYELLTGETPFDGERLRSAAFDELLRIIREEDPPRPSLRLSTSGTLPESAANRQVEPKRLSSLVRGELDWIVMKALEKDRTRRYETATALGADIENYLNDEPVEACPPSSVYMIGKFTRRNKGWLSTAAAVLMTVLVGLTVSTVLIAKERDAAEASAEEADRQRQRAENNLRESRAVVDRLFTRAAEELANVPHMTQVRRALLEDAAEFYEGFLEQKSDDPEIRNEMAGAYRRLGAAYEFLGRYEESVVTTRRAVESYRQLAADYPEIRGYKAELAESYRELAVWLTRSGRTEEAVASSVSALEVAEQLAQKHPTVPSYRRKVARFHVDIANQMEFVPGTVQERVELLRRSLALWEQFRQDFPNLELLPMEEGHTHHWLANNLMKIGRFEEAATHLRRSVDIRTQLLERAPQDVERQHLLAHAQFYLAQAILSHGVSEEAEQNTRSAVKLLGPIVNDFPGVSEYRDHLRRAYEIHAQVLHSQQRSEEAEETQLRVVEVLRLEPDPSLTSAYNLAWALHDLGLLRSHSGDIQRAAESFRGASASFEKVLRESDPDLSLYHRAKDALRWTLITCPLPQFRDAERSIGYSNEFLQQDPQSGDYWSSLGIGHYRAGNWDEAIEALDKSVQLRDGGHVSDCYFLAMAHWRRGEEDTAQTWHERGVELQRDTGGTSQLDFANFRKEAERVLGVANEKSVEDSTPEQETQEGPAQPSGDDSHESSAEGNN